LKGKITPSSQESAFTNEGRERVGGETYEKKGNARVSPLSPQPRRKEKKKTGRTTRGSKDAGWRVGLERPGL